MANGGSAYRDLIAGYVDAVFGPRGVTVYTEVPVGKTIIGKDRHVDVLLVRQSDQQALAVEAKWQSTSGTADEKIPYALQDIEAMWIPGCLVYGGEGWSKGVLHTLEGSRFAVYCQPDKSLRRTKQTLELDHVISAVFGFWDLVLPAKRMFRPPSQMGFGFPGPRPTRPARKQTKAAGGD